MAIAYPAPSFPQGQKQTLPSFRELLPQYLHDEIDALAYYNSAPRPVSVHRASEPALPSQYPNYDGVRETEQQRTAPHFQHHLSHSISPILPPIRDLGARPPAHDVSSQETSQKPPQSPLPSEVRSMSSSPGFSPYPQSPYTQNFSSDRDYSGITVSSPSYITHSENGESKTKKRRGNLPKKVTDILRAWFHAHLDHPYPSEDDKQMLINQTGLTISQISNWFINARRRQLPALRNQVRASTVRKNRSSVDSSGKE
ncbi:hypothetical protein KEM56_002995 [Ascosphaera pollenicola]|nr:hypothetical protein KEM56_002995 [Ascosphaera pollenicola]